MSKIRAKYYSQTDAIESIKLDPVADMRYKYIITKDSFGNGLSSMSSLTIARVGYLEDNLEETIVTKKKVTYDFTTENYLKSISSSIVVLDVDYKNTDIIKHGNSEFINSFIFKTDVKNKNVLQDKELLENLGVTVPTLVKTHKKGNDLITPEYTFESLSDPLEKFTLGYNTPYMPLFFGYKENGYVNNSNLDISINTVIDINKLESKIFYSYDWLGDKQSLVYDLLGNTGTNDQGTVGIYLGDFSASSYYSGRHYKLSTLTSRNHRRKNFQLADQNYSKLENDIIEFKDIPVTLPDGTHKQIGLDESTEFYSLANRGIKTSDACSFLKCNETPDSDRINIAKLYEFFNKNNREFPNNLMKDIGMSIDVREYLYIRDASACGYMSKEIERLGYSYLTHHGSINTKTLNSKFNIFHSKFFQTSPEDISVTSFQEGDKFLKYSYEEPILILNESAELVPPVNEDIYRKYENEMLPYENLDDLVSSTTDVYPFTGLPVFTTPLKFSNTQNPLVKSFYVNEYRFEGIFNNSLPILSSPVPTCRQKIALYYNGTFRAGMGYHLVTRNYNTSAFNSFEGVGVFNTLSDSYYGNGNGIAYALQRLNSRLSIGLSISPSVDKFSTFGKVIKFVERKARILARNRSMYKLSPIDRQNFLVSSQTSEESGYSVPNLYLPTERFNNVFVGYDSIPVFVNSNTDTPVAIDFKSKPTQSRILNILPLNKTGYSLPHSVTGKDVLQLRSIAIPDATDNYYVSAPASMEMSYYYKDDMFDFIPPVCVQKGENGEDVYTMNSLFQNTSNLDDVITGAMSNGPRVITMGDKVSLKSAFTCSRYSEITSTSIMKDEVDLHGFERNGCEKALVEMQSVKGSNPLVRDNINLYNVELLLIEENGHNTTEEEHKYSKYESSFEDTPEVYEMIKPKKEDVLSVVKNYI